MKISSFYLNALLAGLVVLLTFVLVLLYLMQPGNKLPERYTYGVDDSPATYAEIQDIESKITALEKLVATEKTRAEEQNELQTRRIHDLENKLSESTTQLEQSRTAAQTTRELLDKEKSLSEQLGLKLEKEQSLTLEQETSLTSSSAELMMLDKSLQLEKDFVLSLRVDYESDKLKLLDITDQLEQKKRELVRNKRDLTKSDQALVAKKRELTISKGKINDIKRKNQSLNRQISILNNKANTIRQTSQDKVLADSPNS